MKEKPHSTAPTAIARLTLPFAASLRKETSVATCQPFTDLFVISVRCCNSRCLKRLPKFLTSAVRQTHRFCCETVRLRPGVDITRPT